MLCENYFVKEIKKFSFRSEDFAPSELSAAFDNSDPDIELLVLSPT